MLSKVGWRLPVPTRYGCVLGPDSGVVSRLVASPPSSMCFYELFICFRSCFLLFILCLYNCMSWMSDGTKEVLPDFPTRMWFVMCELWFSGNIAFLQGGVL